MKELSSELIIHRRGQPAGLHKLTVVRYDTGPTPRGGIQGPSPPPNNCLCLPKRKLCPPKRGLCPEEIHRIGASGVQIEALDSQNSAYHPRIREQELFFRNFGGLTLDFIKLRVYFGTNLTYFFKFFWSSL